MMKIRGKGELVIKYKTGRYLGCKLSLIFRIHSFLHLRLFRTKKMLRIKKNIFYLFNFVVW